MSEQIFMEHSGRQLNDIRRGMYCRFRPVHLVLRIVKFVKKLT